MYKVHLSNAQSSIYCKRIVEFPFLSPLFSYIIPLCGHCESLRKLAPGKDVHRRRWRLSESLESSDLCRHTGSHNGHFIQIILAVAKEATARILPELMLCFLLCSLGQHRQVHDSFFLSLSLSLSLSVSLASRTYCPDINQRRNRFQLEVKDCGKVQMLCIHYKKDLSHGE